MIRRIATAVIFVSVLGLALAGYWLVATTQGLRFVLDTVVETVPLSLKYTRLQGSLISTIHADKASYETESVSVSIDDFETRINLLSLLRKRISFSQVRSSAVQVLLRQTDASPVATGNASAVDGNTAAQGSTAVAKNNSDDSAGLPVSIGIKHATIAVVNVVQGSNQPLTFNDVSLDRALIRGSFKFENLSFDRQPVVITTTGELGFGAGAVVDMALDWRTEPVDKLPAAGGTTSIKGTYQRLQSETHINKPYKAVIAASVDDLFSDVRWRVNARAERLPLSLIDTALAGELTDLHLTLAGNMSEMNAEITSGMHDPTVGAWSVDASGMLGETQWRLDHLKLAANDRPGSISLQGKSGDNFAYNAQSPMHLQVTWNDMQWPITGAAQFGSKNGSAQLDGSLHEYQLHIKDTQFNWQQHSVTAVNMTASGDWQSLQLTAFNGQYLEGDWRGSGSMSWSDGIHWRVSSQFSKVDPSKQWTTWPARLRGSTELQGAVQGAQWNVSGRINRLAGSLRGLPIDRAKMAFALANDDYDIKEFVFMSGKNRMQGSMHVSTAPGSDSVLTGQWNIAAGDLSQLLPEYGGELQSRGTLGGTLGKPLLSMVGKTKGLQVGDYRAGSLDMSAEISTDPAAKLSVNLQAESLSSQGWNIKDAQLEVKGTLSKHHIKITVAKDTQRNIGVQASGAYLDQTWTGTLESTNIRTGNLGEWYQPRPVAMQFSGGKTQLDKWCLVLRGQSAQACLMVGSRHFDEWYGKLSLSRMPAAQLVHYLPQQIREASGIFNGNAEFDIAGDKITTLSAEITSTKGMLVYGLQSTDRQQFEYKRFDVGVVHDQHGIALHARVNLKDKGNITGKLLLPGKHAIGPLADDQRLDGQIVMDLNDLTILHLVFPEVQFVDGRKYSEFTIGGTFGKPVFVGYSDVSIKSALLPSLGIKLSDVTLRLDYNKQRGIQARGQVTSGDGHVSIEGGVDDYLADNIQATLKVKGENFQAANTAEITVNISPDLALNVNGSALNLRGQLVIPSAEVKILETGTTVTPSDDVVMIDDQGKQQKAEKKLFSLNAEVQVKLGEFVRIQGFGAKGKLRGQVTVREDASGVTTGSGEISIVDGMYSAYSQELVIEKGKLIYASSPMENPLVDIRAQRKINDDVTVGVDVTGYAQNPQVTLFSQPSMDNSDILSYMMLGYPFSQATPQDGSVLASAAGSIGLAGGELLAKNIAKEFGIDEVKIQSDNTTQQTSLVLGEYLSPRLFAQYAVGIGQAVNVLRLEYQLTKQWVLKTESSTERQGTDLLYSIER